MENNCKINLDLHGNVNFNYNYFKQLLMTKGQLTCFPCQLFHMVVHLTLPIGKSSEH